MRVLFTTTPGWGHIHPMVPLAAAFRQRGDEVAWATAAESAPRLQQAGFEVFPCGLGAREAWAAVRRDHPEIETITPGSARRGFPMMFGATRAAPMLDDLSPVVEAWRPALLIHEQAELAGPLLAAAAGIPYVTHAFGQLVDPANLDPQELEVAEMWQARGLEAPRFSGCYDHMYLDIFPPSLDPADKRHIDRVQPIRPVPFASGDDERLPGWVGEGAEPLIYVTFGTVFNEDIAVIRNVVEGVRALPARVIVTVGPDADPAALGDQPSNVHVARYVPQTQLMHHCAVVVSHAGSGTFLAALSQGLPQVCIPQGADQFANARACSEGGLGRVLVPGEVSAESVRAATAEVMSDLRFRQAAQRAQAEIAAMPDPGAVADLITTLSTDRPSGGSGDS